MKLYFIFLSVMLSMISYVYSENLTADDLTIILCELNKNEWEDKEWIISVQRHVGELATRLEEDDTINKKELTALKDQLHKAHEKGRARKQSIRCSPALLSKIVDHANIIKELRSSKNKERHITFGDNEGSEDAV